MVGDYAILKDLSSSRWGQKMDCFSVVPVELLSVFF
jgi:hypothetical protein